MFIVTRKGELSQHPNLGEAVQVAVRMPDSPCWIWCLEVTRLGTLRRVEVPFEEIQETGIEGLQSIRNRCRQDLVEPVDGQLFFTQAGREVKVLEYRREAKSSL